MLSWDKLIEAPDPRAHLVQLYGADEASLTRNVGQYLGNGLRHGDGLLVIATPKHNHAFRTQLHLLGANPDSAVREGQLAFFDAHDTLSHFMVDDQPDWDLFQITMSVAMRRVRAKLDGGGLRAYGEMVGILWNAGQFEAAIQLEQFWNKLLRRSAFSLYCAYAIDVFGKEFQIAELDALMCAHTHLIPAETIGVLESAINTAMEEILGAKAESLRLLIKANFRPSWAAIPRGEAIALWIRNNLPDQAESILARARQHYHQTLNAQAA